MVLLIISRIFYYRSQSSISNYDYKYKTASIIPEFTREWPLTSYYYSCPMYVTKILSC